ncbi:MAG: GNAT family N-acetyltransferase [Pseudomonadota bacterium]|nr:GNAT family N-acetyltransferase [Pseudomonadota bacterium]
MNITLRPGRSDDAAAGGVICYQAFKTIAEAHAFPADFPVPEIAGEFLAYTLSRPDVYSVVAEADGRIAGSNFLWIDAGVGGVGPITVDPALQNGTIGRRLMEDVLAQAQRRGLASVRLVQAAYHNRSLSLYARLGFDAREPLSVMQGPAIGVEIPGYRVRPAVAGDSDACHRLSFKVHGLHRPEALQAAIAEGAASVVEHADRISGYATGLGFFGHAVGESNEDLKALIGAAAAFAGPGFLLPTRNAGLFRWCLDKGLRVVQPMTLMSRGLYNEPAGAFLPSILY